MEYTHINSYLTKLEAEKMPIIQSLSIEKFNGKDYLNIQSEEYQRLSFYIYWLLRYHFRYVLNNRTKATFWLCYEYGKPYLWSVVDDDFIKNLLYLILLPITTMNIEFILYLYTDLCQRLKLNLEFERLSFDWVLDNDTYINLITKNEHKCDELHSIFDPVKLIDEKTFSFKFIESLVILDKNHSSLSVNDQISNILNKLRNLN